jgi:hypothetical protein
MEIMNGIGLRIYFRCDFGPPCDQIHVEKIFWNEKFYFTSNFCVQNEFYFLFGERENISTKSTRNFNKISWGNISVLAVFSIHVFRFCSNKFATANLFQFY